jgi:hypothetical protein
MSLVLGDNIMKTLIIGTGIIGMIYGWALLFYHMLVPALQRYNQPHAIDKVIGPGIGFLL